MSLSVEVKKLSQDVSIEEGHPVTQNYVLFALPNGGMVKAAIDDSAAEALMEALIRGPASTKVPRQDNGYEPPRMSRPAPVGDPPDDAMPAGFAETTLPDGSTAYEFGGEDHKEPPPKPVALHVRARPKIQADEKGNPIVSSPSGNSVDPGEIMSGSNSDEDGVASI